MAPELAQLRRSTATAGGDLRRASACAVLLLGTVLLAGEHARHQFNANGWTATAKWAATPAVLISVPAAPAVANPVELSGDDPPARGSDSVITPAVQTVRRVGLSRFGGRVGP